MILHFYIRLLALASTSAATSDLSPQDLHDICAQRQGPLLSRYHSRGPQIFPSTNPTSPRYSHNRDTSHPPATGSWFEDGLGNLVSEDEYDFQVLFQEENGHPYARDRASELSRLNRALRLTTHSGVSCDGAITATIVEREVCYQHLHGSAGVWVDSIPSNCEVVVYDDGACMVGAEPSVFGLGSPDGCHVISEGFGSLRVTCGELPP